MLILTMVALESGEYVCLNDCESEKGHNLDCVEAPSIDASTQFGWTSLASWLVVRASARNVTGYQTGLL